MITNDTSSNMGDTLEPRPSSRQLYQREKVNSSLSANRLRFSQVGLYGREEEQATLLNCLDRVSPTNETSTSTGRELVLIKGYSGVGKSRLAVTLEEHVAEGVFCVGKFDLHLRDEPYSGVASACRAICRELLSKRSEQSNKDPIDGFTEMTVKEIGIDLISLFSKIIPELKLLIGEDSRNEEEKVDEGMEPEFGSPETKAQFNYAFRIFIRFVASFFSPVVMVLDDLQWADPASLELMQVLLTDSENTHFMIVGLYRANEVNRDHSLTTMISNLHSKAEGCNLRITDISIGDLGVSQVENILQDALSMDPGTTTDLAEICVQRTSGNAFFLNMFLSNLKAQDLLTFELGEFSWKWDVSVIASHSMATDNVVDLVTNEIRSFPEDVQHFLTIAACLGSSFDKFHLEALQRDFSIQDKQSAFARLDLMKALEFAVEARFLSLHDSGAYRFVHDQIQESAFNLLNVDEVCALKTEIGHCLVVNLEPDQFNQSLFVVVNLLNEGTPPNGNESDSLSRFRLCELNRDAAQKAMSVSAFESASKYAKVGLNMLLGDAKLSPEEDILRVELLLIFAKCNMCVGDSNAAQSACRAVLDNEKAAFVDRLLAYEVMTDVMGISGDTQSAISLSLSGLREAGCKFPRRHAIKVGKMLVGLLKVKRKINNVSYDDISNLPLMKDKVHLREMRLLDRLGHFVYMAGDGESVVLSILKRLDLTWNEGLCESTAGCLAILAVVLVGALGELQTASRIAYMALDLCKDPRLKMGAARAITVALMVLPWTEPLQKLEKSCFDGYKVGLKTGDTESAAWSIDWFIEYGFRAGRSLSLLKADCETYTRHLAELNLPMQVLTISCAHQTILNLIGESKNTFQLQGSALTDPNTILNDTKNPAVGAAFHTFHFRAHLLFGNVMNGAEYAISYEPKFLKDAVGYSGYADQAFTMGILLFSAARMTRSRRYAKRAKKMRKLVDQWVKDGYPGVHHRALLHAEEAALHGNEKDAKNHYQKAMVVSNRAGYLMDSALANELFSKFLLTSMKANQDEDEAAYRLKEAIRCYEEWGAVKKVELLREEFSTLLA